MSAGITSKGLKVWKPHSGRSFDKTDCCALSFKLYLNSCTGLANVLSYCTMHCTQSFNTDGDFLSFHTMRIAE